MDIKLFIIGEINDFSDETINEFSEREVMLSEKGYNVINPYKINDKGDSKSNILKRSINALLECECISLTDTWQSSDHAMLLWMIATKLDLRFI
ncbi:MAG: DUF4406 domain-containing protein [Bacteroidales bacterium]|nr:DUF4406 domain-containing protein [Bacteroidales bacterium]